MKNSRYLMAYKLYWLYKLTVGIILESVNHWGFICDQNTDK